MSTNLHCFWIKYPPDLEPLSPQIHHPLHLDRMLASIAIAHVLVLSANYLQFPTMVLQTASAKTFNIIQKYSHLNGEISHLRFWANAL